MVSEITEPHSGLEFGLYDIGMAWHDIAWQGYEHEHTRYRIDELARE